MNGAQPQKLWFSDDGLIPNSHFPVLLYRDVPLASTDKAAGLEQLFNEHDWPAQWRAQVFDFHHYHSTAHEVVGVACGKARLLLGGPSGQEIEVVAGDVLVLPAGTGHCSLEQSDDFLVVGAYPRGQDNYDIQRAEPANHQPSLRRIGEVGFPAADPVQGPEGALMSVWGAVSL
ncbi:cupin [Pseudomonas sp. Pseusp122]|uniref:cupin n=1 Tax=unclassified Pseudomonas TaxID=196821 RepID=UPI0039A518D4